MSKMRESKREKIAAFVRSEIDAAIADATSSDAKRARDGLEHLDVVVREDARKTKTKRVREEAYALALPSDATIAKWKSAPQLQRWMIDMTLTTIKGERTKDFARSFQNVARTIDKAILKELFGSSDQETIRDGYRRMFFEMGVPPSLESVTKQMLSSEEAISTLGEIARGDAGALSLRSIWNDDARKEWRGTLYLAAWLYRMAAPRKGPPRTSMPMDTHYLPLVDRRYAKRLYDHLMFVDTKQRVAVDAALVGMAYSVAAARGFREYRRRLRDEMTEEIALAIDASALVKRAYNESGNSHSCETLTDAAFVKLDALRSHLVDSAARTSDELAVPDHMSLRVNVEDWTDAVAVLATQKKRSLLRRRRFEGGGGMIVPLLRSGKRGRKGIVVSKKDPIREVLPLRTSPSVSSSPVHRVSMTHDDVVRNVRRYSGLDGIVSFPPISYLPHPSSSSALSLTDPVSVVERRTTIAKPLPTDDLYDASAETAAEVAAVVSTTTPMESSETVQETVTIPEDQIDRVENQARSYLKDRVVELYSTEYPNVPTPELMEAEKLISDISARYKVLPDACRQYVAFEDRMRERGEESIEKVPEPWAMLDPVYGSLMPDVGFVPDVVESAVGMELSTTTATGDESSVETTKIGCVSLNVEHGDVARGNMYYPWDARRKKRVSPRSVLANGDASASNGDRRDKLPNCAICGSPVELGYQCPKCKKVWFCSALMCRRQRRFHVCGSESGST